jgi:hypothetical protein
MKNRPEINPELQRRLAGSLAKQSATKPCCKVPANLEPEEANNTMGTALLRCRVCFAGHRYMFCETGEIGVKHR